MCVGVTVTLAPPTALASGYYLWHCGQDFALSSSLVSHHIPQTATSTKTIHYDITPPPQSILSYISGIATLSGSYLALDHCIHKWEVSSSLSSTSTKPQTPSSSVQQNSKYFLPHKASPSQAFRPPQTVPELMERLGPPLLSRLGAASFSFFCAGAVQTYVASCLR